MPEKTKESQAAKPAASAAAAGAEVSCPDCASPMKPCTDVVVTYSRPTCPVCQSLGELVGEKAGVRTFRCAQARHRVKKSNADRDALYSAAVAKLDPKSPQYASELGALSKRFYADPATDPTGRIVMDEPVTWQDAGRRSRYYHCTNAGCRYAAKMVDRLVGGRKVQEDAGMRHKVRLDEKPKFDFSASRRCACGSLRTKLRSVRDETAWRDCMDCGAAYRVEGVEL